MLRRRHRTAGLVLATLLAVAALAAAPPAATAADPIMPLGEVRAGMRCTALTVIRGTEISQFDVEVLDILDTASTGGSAYILVRASGPAIADTGIASGFSGSPVMCPDATGLPRTIGAIAFGVGDYGNFVSLVTPIETMLGQQVTPPRSARAASPALMRLARPLQGPLTVTGLSPAPARALARAAARVGIRILSAPAGPLGGFPVQTLRPGASLSAMYATGDMAVGSVGTVTYVDGDRVYGFGHALNDAGRRALLMGDAYVFATIGNPVGIEGATSYKLASPGHVLGTLTNDTPVGVIGRTGPPPETTRVRVNVVDGDTGNRHTVRLQVADETAVGQPTAISNLALTTPLALAQSVLQAMRGSPASQTGSMCARIVLRERREPIRFCNRYLQTASAAEEEEGTGPVTGAMAADVGTAIGLIDNNLFAELHVRSVDITANVRRGLREAVILRAGGPRRVRPGQRIRVRVRVKRLRGRQETITVPVRVPRNLRPGRRTLRLQGPSPEQNTRSSLEGELVLVLEDEPVEKPPRTLNQLVRRIRALQRYDGLTARFGSGPSRRAFRDRDLLLTGSTRLAVRVVGP